MRAPRAAVVGRRFGVALVGFSVNILASGSVAAAQPLPGVEGAAVIRIVLALLLVLALIGGLAWMLRRYGPVQGAVSGELRVLASLSVGHRERVVLVQIGETQLLLGVAPGRVQTLHVLDRPVAGVSGTNGVPREVQGSPFAERLRRMMQQPGR